MTSIIYFLSEIQKNMKECQTLPFVGENFVQTKWLNIPKGGFYEKPA